MPVNKAFTQHVMSDLCDAHPTHLEIAPICITWLTWWLTELQVSKAFTVSASTPHVLTKRRNNTNEAGGCLVFTGATLFEE